jgi:tetratricopeptide (TPR) repeat protein
MAVPCALQLLASHESFLARERPPGPLAIVAAERATRLAPWNDLYAAGLAEALRQNAWNSGDTRGALVRADSAALRAVALAPERSFDHQVLGLARLARFAAGEPQQADSAAAAIARCTALAPYNVLPALQFAQEISRLGRADLALPGAERAVEAYPNEALPRAVLGGVRLAMGDSAAARREFTRALDATWHAGPLRRGDVELVLQRMGPGAR